MKESVILMTMAALAALTASQVPVTIDDACRKYQPYGFNGTSVGSKMTVYFDMAKEERIEDVYTLKSVKLRKSCYKVQRIAKNSADKTGSPVFETANQLDILYAKDDGTTFRFLVPAVVNSTLVNQNDNLLKSVQDFIEKSSDINGKFGFNTPTGFTSIVLREFQVPTFSTIEDCPASDAPAPTGDKFNYDCLLGEEPYSKYFLNQMTYDWPLWWMIFVVLTFVFVTNFQSNHMVFEERFRDNYWTFHPLYSVNHCASEVIFTRRSRMTQMYLIFCAIGFFNALMTKRYIEQSSEPDQPLALRLTVFPIFSIIFSIFSAYIAGIILNFSYRSHQNYIDQIQHADTHQSKKEVVEIYEASKYRRLYFFFIFTAMLSLFYLAMSIWFLYSFKLENQGWWLLQVVIAIAFDWIVLDILIVFLARISFLKSLFKLRGFWFDYELHERYMQAAKVH
jgi:hypothetical protein